MQQIKNILARQEIEKLDYERSLDQTPNTDIRVQGLLNNMSIQGKKILNIGTLDGFHDVQLTMAGAQVTASDIRPENLHRALFRALYFGCNDMTFRVLDMETMHQEIKKDEFDIIFHSGCFYHLADPVRHLWNISTLARYILLETHIGNPEKYSRGIIEHRGYQYSGTLYPEGTWSDNKAAKDDRFSFWLDPESLKMLFDNCMLQIVDIIYMNFPNPHGPRNCYLLKRAGE